MLLEGKNIMSSADKLNKINIDYLYHSLRNPRPEMGAHIRQLRIVRDLDRKQYAMLKRQLPYFVCGVFNPPFRRTENFAYTEYFMLDIDKLADKGFGILETRTCLEKDERIMMSFLSPSGDGLKLLFRLKERCYDAGHYSLFYKAFVKEFSLRYNLEQAVDTQTCDVCRACFFSSDPYAFFNANAVSVDLNTYLDLGNVNALFDLKHSLEKEIQQEKPNKETHIADPDSDVLHKIKETLQLKAQPKEKIPVYVPQQLEDIMGDLRLYVTNAGIDIYEIINIQYGKKLRFKIGNREAELNIFYGKRGFSVVQSPRSGTSSEFNQLMADVVEGFLAGLM